MAGVDDVRDHLQAPPLHRGVHQGQPAGQRQGPVRLRPAHARVLVPGHVVRRAAVQARRRLGPQVLDGRARDVGAEEGLHGVEQVAVSQEVEDRPGPQVVDVHAAADLRALGEEPGVAREEGFVFVEVVDLARGAQVPRLPVDELRHGVDHGVQVGVVQHVLDDHQPAVVKLIQLRLGQGHGRASCAECCAVSGAVSDATSVRYPCGRSNGSFTQRILTFSNAVGNPGKWERGSLPAHGNPLSPSTQGPSKTGPPSPGRGLEPFRARYRSSTVTGTVLDKLPCRAVICAVPYWTATTVPRFTVATVGSLVDHSTTAPMISF